MTPRLRILVCVARLALAGLVSTGCASGSPVGASAFRVECNVAQAAVYIDDVFVGRVSEWSAAGRFIRPGFHRVELREPMHHPHYAEITATDGGSSVVQATLRPLLD